MKKINSTMQVKKTALYVLLIYIIMQLSSIALLKPFFELMKKITDFNNQKTLELTNGWYIALSMGLALIFTLILTIRDKHFWHVYKEKRTGLPVIFMWGVIGFFMVLFGQSLGVMIETRLGINPGSENTAAVANIAMGAPIAILAIVVFGPILEEIIFRRIIFGSLVQTTNFWVAAFVSAIFFGLIHADFTHIILYTISGLCFAFLYQQTKSILAPILAHMLLNGFVTIVQLYQEPLMKYMEQIQSQIN